MMRYCWFLILSILPLWAQAVEKPQCAALFNTPMRLLHSDKTINVCDIVKNHPVLVVNTASHCGFTPQFKSLEQVYQRYKDKGLVVLGFASDDFYQEANDENEAATICYINFGVTFTVFAPTHVRGKKANAVFLALNKQTSSPSWNFNKYLVNNQGKVVKKFGSTTKPDDADFINAIEVLLAK